jgi:hypothetical protein
MAKKKAVQQPSEYRGKCPVCSGKLELKENRLVCSDHFEISNTIFEAAWDKYELSPTSVNGTLLLKTLLDNNLSTNKPNMNGLWEVPGAEHVKDS